MQRQCCKKSKPVKMGHSYLPNTKKRQNILVHLQLLQIESNDKKKPYPIQKIQDLLLTLEGFQFATSLDLNMGYYHTELDPESSRLCTNVLPW